MTLYLAIDTSGSMAESGKRFMARSIALAVEQYCRFGYASAVIRLISANGPSRAVEWSCGDEYPPALLNCSGSLDVRSLSVLISREYTKVKVLLVTDGAWGEVENRAFNEMMRLIPADGIRIVKVGSEKSPYLQAHSSRNIVFNAEQILEALDGWIVDSSIKRNVEEEEW